MYDYIDFFIDQITTEYCTKFISRWIVAFCFPIYAFFCGYIMFDGIYCKLIDFGGIKSTDINFYSKSCTISTRPPEDLDWEHCQSDIEDKIFDEVMKLLYGGYIYDDIFNNWSKCYHNHIFVENKANEVIILNYNTGDTTQEHYFEYTCNLSFEDSKNIESYSVYINDNYYIYY